MASEAFAQLEQQMRANGPAQAFDFLIAHYREQKEYGRMFEARLTRERHALGLPLIPVGPPELDGEALRAYEAAMAAAARETADLYLAENQIQQAWPFCRALGDTTALRDAIERTPPESGDDALIEIALGERLHPAKGFEMLLAKHGICRAITLFDQYPDPATREESLALLARTLHGELIANLRSAIERYEGAAPDARTIPELIANRDWLFGEYCYHVDVSHLMSLVRLSADSTRPETIALGLDFAEYGSQLHSSLRHRSDPPFDDFYPDYAVYLRALLGREVDEAIAHFRRKVDSYDYEQIGNYPVQVLVRMLLTFGRPKVALEVFDQYLIDTNPAYLNCPPLEQLCQLAGDFDRLKQLAEADDDLLRYAAALVQST